MKILIDNGHGINTAGKCSPDGIFREYKYAREIAAEVVKRLRAEGYDAERIVTEEADISLTERCNRVNSWCNKLGKMSVMLVSIHNDAKGADGKWHEARGFTARVGTSAGDKSIKLAQILWDRAIELGLKGNRCVPDYRCIAQRLQILNGTKCPAVLTENLFQDNKEDVQFLLSPQGRETIVRLHIDGIKEYVKRYGKK